MSEVYIGLRKRRKRTHPSKCPCCIADQEVEPENEASAGSENTIDVIKENRQIKRKRAIKRKPNETRSESESEQNYSETKSPPTKKSRKLRSSSEESPQQSTTAKKVSKTRCKSNHEKSTKSEKTLTKSKTKKGGVKTKNISNKELKSNNKNTKTSEHDSDEDIKRDEGEGQHEDVVTAAKASKNKARSHNNKRKATKSNCGRVKPHPINTKTKQGNSKTEDDDEDDHLTSKSVKVKKTVSKQAVKGKALRRVPVEKPSLAFIKTASKTKGSALTQVVQLKISVFDDLYSKLKSRNKDISIEEAAEMLSKISSDNLLIAFKTSQKPDKLGSNASRQEKKVISDTEEIVSQAAEALVSFRAKSPISREDPNKSEKINSTQSSFTSTTAPLISQAGEKVKPSVTAAASAVQALMQFQSSSSVPCTFPSTLTSSKVPQNMLHGVLPAVTLSQSFPQLLQPNLTTSFTNLMPMVSSHATLPSFSQIAAHLRPPPPMSGITNTLSSNLPGGMQSPLITPSLSSASVPSTSLMLPNQPLLQPQLQQPLPLTNPVTSCKPNLTAVKNTAPTVETTANKTTTQKQNPLQQPLKGMEEVVGNVGTNVPQPILWNLKSPVVFLGSPQNLGGVPRNLVASPSTSQSGTSLEQAGYRPVAPKPVSKSDTSHSTAAPVSSVPNLLTLGGRPILPRTQLQGGDDNKKLQTPQSGMPFIPQLPSINPSHPYQAAGSALQPLTQVSAASPKRTTLMSVSLPSSSIITNLPSSSTSVGQTLSPFMQQSIQDNTSVKCTSPSTVSAKQAVKKLVHERTKSAELKKEASGGANPHTTTKLKAILPLPPKDPSTSTVTSTETKSNEFNLEQAATALLSIGVPDGIETIGLKQGSSDPSKDDYEEDVVFTSKGTFRVGDVDVDPRYNRIGREGYTCGKCNKIFTSLSYLARHIKRVCPDMSCRKWKCTLCDKAFRHPFGLQQHVYTHTGERPHKCPLCPKAFYSSNDLRRHSRIHSGERPYRCKHCDKSFATTISLKTHTYIHTGEKPHKCPQCPKTFATSSKLGRHIVTHSEQRPYSCDQCPKSFNRSGDLRRHNLAVHDGKEKSFECEVCPSTFSKSADLRRHNVTVHQKTVKTLQCEDCGTQFTTQLCLKMHRDTYHKKSSSTDSDKIHTCDVCGKTYSNAALLTKHKATHESTAAYNLSQFQHIAPKPSEQLMNEGGTG